MAGLRSLSLFEGERSTLTEALGSELLPQVVADGVTQALLLGGIA